MSAAKQTVLPGDVPVKARPAYTMAQMILEVGLEIDAREELYPKRVEAGRMKQTDAVRKTDVMKAVRDVLRYIDRNGDFLRECDKRRGLVEAVLNADEQLIIEVMARADVVRMLMLADAEFLKACINHRRALRPRLAELETLSMDAEGEA